MCSQQILVWHERWQLDDVETKVEEAQIHYAKGHVRHYIVGLRHRPVAVTNDNWLNGTHTLEGSSLERENASAI
jgi:hypothetical protein